MPQLAQQEIDRQRQLGRREHFLAHRGQNFLGRDVYFQPLGECPKEMGLLDVFLAPSGASGERLRLVGHYMPPPVCDSTGALLTDSAFKYLSANARPCSRHRDRTALECARRL